MASFQFEAMDNNGKLHKGNLDAPSQEFAVNELREQGLFVQKLSETQLPFWKRDIPLPWVKGPQVKRQHFVMFCRQLATLHRAGIPMVQAVRMLVHQTESKPFKPVLEQVANDMNTGTHFSQAIAKFPTVFPAIFVSMSKAGEMGGNMDVMLDRLAVFYEKDHFLKEKVKTALTYPVFLLIVTIVVVIVLMIFVVPKFESNFNSMGMQLPLPTRILMAVSEWFQTLWFIIPIIPILALFGLNKMKQSAEGRYRLDRMKLKLPIVGKFIQNQIVARFSRTFSSLTGTGVSLMETLAIISVVVNNEVISRVINESRESLNAGKSIADPFEKSEFFPPMLVLMIRLGEEAGTLESVMTNVAEYYETELDSMAERLKSLLEPLLIVVLAGVVGMIVVAMLMPSFSMIDQFE